MQQKIHCDHDWKKFEDYLIKRQFQAVIENLATIHVLEDLWYLLEAYFGLNKLKEAESLFEDWRFKISNSIENSYFHYYQAKIFMNKGSLNETKDHLMKALAIAEEEKDIVIKEKILKILSFFNK